MKVLITGGHFSPAHAVIGELKERGAEIAVAGRRYPFEGDSAESYEYAVVKRQNLKFYEIKAGRFQRKFTAYSATSLLRTPAGFLSALSILRDFKPDVVLTFGGYIGLPIAYAARTLGIPVVLHEQTQRAGLASKMIAKVAAKILVGFESSENHFPKGKVIVTGNPLRSEIFKTDEKIDIPSGKNVIYITGGSTGSHFINTQISKILPQLLEKFVVVHQTGENKFEDYEMLSAIRKDLSGDLAKNYILKKFVTEDEIGYVLKSADLIIARSGINTVSEILVLEKVSLLIPLPSGQMNEQLDNAKLVKDFGTGEYILQVHAAPEKILATIDEIFANFDSYKKNTATTAQTIGRNAEKKICDFLDDYYGETRN